jgi:hypothetical protein
MSMNKIIFITFVVSIISLRTYAGDLRAQNSCYIDENDELKFDKDSIFYYVSEETQNLDVIVVKVFGNIDNERLREIRQLNGFKEKYKKGEFGLLPKDEVKRSYNQSKIFVFADCRVAPTNEEEQHSEQPSEAIEDQDTENNSQTDHSIIDT